MCVRYFTWCQLICRGNSGSRKFLNLSVFQYRCCGKTRIQTYPDPLDYRYSVSKTGKRTFQSSVFPNPPLMEIYFRTRFCKIRFTLQGFPHLGCDLELFVSKFPQHDLRNKSILQPLQTDKIFQVHCKNTFIHSKLKGSWLRRNLSEVAL